MKVKPIQLAAPFILFLFFYFFLATTPAKRLSDCDLARTWFQKMEPTPENGMSFELFLDQEIRIGDNFEEGFLFKRTIYSVSLRKNSDAHAELFDFHFSKNGEIKIERKMSISEPEWHHHRKITCTQIEDKN